ncbi:MAG: GNAT family N-acetyltransferase [Lachnospiraceae bacterium]|nr:GNAT family N-acetyltransferase [Lachnospiraceae bacterium]
MNITELKPEYDLALADLIRVNLKKHALDIPGTVYFDDNLNHLSDFYLADPCKRYYYILTDDNDKLVGGIGLAELDFLEDCAELQKLYLDDSVKGAGLSYRLISMIEDKAKELGYRRIYLETHDNLAVAIHVYEKSGYKEIDKPVGVVHATMNRFFLKELT